MLLPVRLAVAIGFRMNLFNIGVDGQYRLAACSRPRSSPARSPGCPGRCTIASIVVVAMAVGALWAGIAGCSRSPGASAR